MFSTRLDNFLPFLPNLKLSSANFLSLEESKICRLVMGEGLNLYQNNKMVELSKLKSLSDNKCGWLLGFSPFLIMFTTLHWLNLSSETDLNQSKKFVFHDELTLNHTIPTLNDPENEAFWKHCGKRRKCWWPAFSPFPTMFSPSPNKNLCLSSANAVNLDLSKNLSFGNQLRINPHLS